MSWLSIREIGDRIAALHALNRARQLNPAECAELDRLDHNRTQRMRRLTAQAAQARAKAERLAAEIRECAA